MPIRPENVARYPADWPAISARVREEAGQCCEWCAAPNGALIRRGNAGGCAVWRLSDDPAPVNGRCAETGAEVPDTGEDPVGYGAPVRVILTVAHLDHQPENCARENLRALCQRCHNRYDAPARAAGRQARSRAERAVGDLFAGPYRREPGA